MTIKQIQYFLHIAETGNMSRTARDLYVSQPALSMAMKELEKETGTALFIHNGNRLELTEAGSELRKDLVRIYRLYSETEERIRGGGLTRKYLRLGFSTVVGNIPAAEICSRFCAAYPDIHLDTVEDYGFNLLSRLQEGSLDCVITGSTYAERKEWKGKFGYMRLKPSTIGFFMPADHPLAERTSVTPEEIASQPIIMLNDAYPVSRKIETEFQERGLPLHIILRTAQMYTVERFIAGGVGCGFLPVDTVETNNRIIHIPCTEMDMFAPMSAGLYWRREQPLDEAVRIFLKTAENP